MNWYHTIEKELAHVKNAIQILEETREQFPPGTIVSEPKYWRNRLHAIRDLAERHNHHGLKTQANELLTEVEKLQR
ncbi:hypothetical protein [Burkholderia contaminans]|uniref:hypothetical protein n=1 Tax=Burkholderia contaminans TaxID=488447 RepID=UPI00158AD22B|nr:hypothetical protein [Burkholderia contaminans]